MKKQNAGKGKARKKGSPLFLLVIALFLLISALVLLRFSGFGAAPGSDSFKSMVDNTELMQYAKGVKQDIKDLASALKENDLASAEQVDRQLSVDVAALKEYLDAPLWRFARYVPVIGREVRTAEALVSLSEDFSAGLLKSWIALQERYPFTELKTEEGYNYAMLPVYAAFMDEHLPEVRSMVDRLDGLDLHMVDDSGRIGSYLKLAKPLLRLAEKYSDSVIQPGAAFVAENPPSELKTEEGFNIPLAAQYFEFLNTHLPDVKAMLEDLETTDLSLVDKDGKLRSYLELAKPLVAIAEQYSENLIRPGFALITEHPLSELKTEEDGYNFELIGTYSDFLVKKEKIAAKFLEELSAVDLSPIDKEGKLADTVSLAQELLEIGVPANEKLLRPALQLLKDHPLSSVKVENGYDVRVVIAYLDFAEEILPRVDELVDSLRKVDLSQVDKEGKISHYVDKLIELRDLAMEYKDLIPAARVVLGNGEKDRLYFFPAQNAAEVRASGGFPGNAALVSITNGILTLGDIVSGYAFYTPRTPSRAKITPQEVRLFTERMYAPWDVDFCIDFERVASIWAMSVSDTMGLKFDGVITATPVVIQKLLSAFDEPIVLSNGMTLDGTTATRVLQRDIYFEYKRAGMNVYPVDDMTDILFSETVSKTMEKVSENMDPGHILDYIKIFQDCVEERIVLLWMADDDEQEILREVGWSGSLNSDPEDPKLGIFFSSEQSSKMGYFFDMIPSVGEPVKNEDGSCTYDVTLTLGNTISSEEQRIGGTWILGRYYIGSVVGDLTLTAPAGGRITDITMSNRRGMRNEEYCGLDTHYVQWLIIGRGETIVVNFKVTTAPGVDAPLGIMATPTLTKYRS